MDDVFRFLMEDGGGDYICFAFIFMRCFVISFANS